MILEKSINHCSNVKHSRPYLELLILSYVSDRMSGSKNQNVGFRLRGSLPHPFLGIQCGLLGFAVFFYFRRNSKLVNFTNIFK
jgi:hypothetical protein